MKERPSTNTKAEQGPKYLGTVRNIDEAIEKLESGRKGDAVGIEIWAGSFQQRDEFVDDFKKEFKRRKVAVKLETTPMLDKRDYYLMTITKDSK